MVSWLIEFSKEADNYIDDNGELILDVYRAITDLAKKQGVPTMGWHTEMTPNEVWFDVGNHIIVYERVSSRQVIRVTVLKPKPDV